jgi:hypothetical protein
MLTHRKSRGIAIVAVLISAVVFLGIVIAITGTLSLSSRQSTGDQRVTLEAQYAAESGLSRAVSEGQTGLLKTWSLLMFQMATSSNASVADIQEMAARFCNYADRTAVPAPTATTYCVNETSGSVTDRYEVFASTIPLSAYADPALDPPPTSVPTTVALARAYWADAFSGGNFGGAGSGIRFSQTVNSGVRYDVAFGLQPAGVALRGDPSSPSFVFQFQLRDAVSTGSLTSGANVLSRRVSQRIFPEVYEIVITPGNISSFSSLTDRQSSVNQSGNLDKTIFTSNSLFDGPVHTNGAFYLRGNPWFSNNATSAGCLRSNTNGLNYDPTLVQPVCTRPGGTVTGYYNDGDLLEDADYTEFNVTAGRATFPGYDGTLGATAPEFVRDNFDPSGAGTYTPDAAPTPWDYTGKYDARIIKLPQSSSRQRQMAAAPNPPFPEDPTKVGILVETAVDPVEGKYYSSPAPEVYMQATNSGLTTNTTFAAVPNNGTAANYQLIRIQAKKKISNCRAGPASIAITPTLNTINIGDSKPFAATVTPLQTDYTFTLAPTSLEVDDWQVVFNPTGNVGNLVASGGNDLNATYTSVSGGTPVGQPVRIRARGLGGMPSNEAQIEVNAEPTTLGALVSISPNAGTGVNWQATSNPTNQVTVTWPTAGGSSPFTYKLYAITSTSSTAPAFSGSYVEVASGTFTSATVTVNTATRNEYIHYRVKAISSTGLEAMSSNSLSSRILARGPAVTYNGSTSATPTYSAAAKTFTYTGGVITPTWSVNNSLTQNSNSGVGPGPFTGQIQVRSRNGSGAWTAYSGGTSGIVATSTTNFAYNYTIPPNTSSVVREYQFQVLARNTTTALNGSYVSSVETFKVAPIVDPLITLAVPSPNNLPFGGGTGTSLSWSVTNSGPNTPGPFLYTVQQQSGAVWNNVAGAVDISTTTLPITPTLTTSYRVTVKDTATTRTNDSGVQTVTVQLLPLPEIISFQPATLPSGSTNTLLWTVKNAANVTTEKIYPTAVTYSPATFVPDGTLKTGNRPVTVDNPYSEFRLTATNATGSVTQLLRVYNNGGAGGPALPQPPSLVTFSASPTTVYYPNNTSTLAWGATNAATSKINGVTVTPAGGGSQVVTLSSTTSYTLVVSNPGGSVTLTRTVTYIPANPPEVSLTAANASGSPSTSNFNFGGGTANFNWNVTNKNAGANISGAGPDPYTYVLEGRVDGGAWSTITTSATTSFSGLSIPPNNTAVPVVRDYRVKATNDGTTLSGTSLNASLTVNPSQTPDITLNGNGPFNHPGGTANLTWSINNQAAAGTGPYTYQLQREIGPLNSGNWGTGFAASTPFGESITTSTRYLLTATNTLTGKSNSKSVIVVVNPPDPPLITSFAASPNVVNVEPAPGPSVLTWSLSALTTRPYTSLVLNGPGIPANTNVFGQSSYSVPVTVYGINTYTLSAKYLTNSPTNASTTVNFKPPEVLEGLTGSGSVFPESKSGPLNPGWTVSPQWSVNRTGGNPTVVQADYRTSVSPDDGTIVDRDVSAAGAVTFKVGDLPNALRPGQPYTLTVFLKVNGIEKQTQFTINVSETGSGGSLRPRARLTQTPCTYGGPVDYSWPTFIEYMVEKNLSDGSMTLYKREYGSTVQTAHVKPADGGAWSSSLGTFNGVIYVDGGARVSGPDRTNATLPDTAPPAVAHFARLTLATDGVLTVLSDLKYEKPACTSSPTRLGNGTVDPADCPTSGYERNVLGLFSSSANNFTVNPPVRGGINIKTTIKNTTIHAVMLASQGQIEVDGVPSGASPCKSELNSVTGADVGNINIQGGLIQQNYGQFQSRPNGAGVFTCGYGRSMTFDQRMLDTSFQPPAFPPADNIPWSVRFRTSSMTDPNVSLPKTGPDAILPLTRGFSSNR